MELLKIPFPHSIKVQNAGLFISPGHGIHPARVISSHELILVKSGHLGIAEEEKEFTVGAGEALLLWPDRRHRGTASYAPNLSFYWVHFDCQTTGYEGTRGVPQHVRVQRPERMAELFHRLLDDQESGTQPAEEASLQLLLMFCEMLRGDSADTPAFGHALAGRAERYIAETFAKGIHACDVALHTGCNLDYLGRVYRRTYGHTISEAIHRRQLQEARALLRDSQHNIEEVALSCGFAEPRYFRKLFTEYQGISPRTYRKIHARVHVNTR